MATDDKVVLRWHTEGTHRSEFAGLTPTGAQGSVTRIGIDRWKDGLVVEAWTEWTTSDSHASSAPRRWKVTSTRRSEMGVQRLTARWRRTKNQT
jgi:hypothetical protein